MDNINKNNFKAYLQLIKKDIIRIKQLEDKQQLKQELQELSDTIQLIIEE